jgi:hypothetical protein
MVKIILLLLLLSSRALAAGGIVNGQPVNAAITNAAFLFKNGNDSDPFILNFTSTNPSSGSSVLDIQKNVNECFSFAGGTVNSAYNVTPTWATSNRGSSSDSLFTRAEATDTAFNGSSGHTHDGSTGNGPKILGTNIKSTGGTSGQFLTADGSGNSYYSTPSFSGVTSIYSDSNPTITGSVQFVSGTNVTLSQTGSAITINASGSSFGGIVTSSSSGAFITSSTSYTAVTGLSVTITTHGRPIWIGLIADGTTSASSIEAFCGGTGGSGCTTSMQILRGATVVATSQVVITVNPTSTLSRTSDVPVSSLNHIDAPSAGTYTYTVQIKTNNAVNSASIYNGILVAYEL